MSETRIFRPNPEFSSHAHIKSMAEYQALYDRAKEDPAAFWGDLARKELNWFEEFTTALDW